VPDAKSARFDTPAPKAGGGETGGKGTDVANVNTAGKDFPYPAYLHNIVTQIAPVQPRQRQMLTADVQFVIKRDGALWHFDHEPSGLRIDLKRCGQGARGARLRSFAQRYIDERSRLFFVRP
jgi:hypothetical protein